MPFECCVCGRSIGSELGLQAHVSTRHLNWQPFECFHCATFAATAAELSVHLHAAHPRLPAKHVFSADAAKQLQLDRLVRRSLGRVAPPSNPPPSLLKLDIADSSMLPLQGYREESRQEWESGLVAGDFNESLLIGTPKRAAIELMPPPPVPHRPIVMLQQTRFADLIPRTLSRPLKNNAPSDLVITLEDDSMETKFDSVESPTVGQLEQLPQPLKHKKERNAKEMCRVMLSMQNEGDGSELSSSKGGKKQKGAVCETKSKDNTCQLCQHVMKNMTYQCIDYHIYKKHIQKTIHRCPTCAFSTTADQRAVHKHLKNVHKDTTSKVIDDRAKVKSEYWRLLAECFPNCNKVKRAARKSTLV